MVKLKQYGPHYIYSSGGYYPMAFSQFMSTTTGRLIRIIAGLALILAGLFLIEGTLAIVLVVVGFVPLLAAVFNVCLFAPLFGGTFKGTQAKS
jgi:hypothetical protein